MSLPSLSVLSRRRTVSVDDSTSETVSRIVRNHSRAGSLRQTESDGKLIGAAPVTRSLHRRPRSLPWQYRSIKDE